MKPNRKWIDDWQNGIQPAREKDIATDLLSFFLEFWGKQKLDEKSKSTISRYCSSLHALGGYLVEQSISDEDLGKTVDELLFENIGPYDGPLIFHDNESWQDEVDMVCRKIYKHMDKKC
ncbi:MAG: hypothetical protein KAG99_06750 [Bacteroidales bacterium]|nr:hypothetical protein [Bacteroidales bacterium]